MTQTDRRPTPRVLDAEHPIPRAALDAFRRGATPLPLNPYPEQNGRSPKRPREGAWQSTRYGEAAGVLRAFTEGGLVDGINLGAIMHNGLADVDLDSDAARLAAPLILPATPAVFGRASAPRAHYVYQITGGALAERYVKHDDGDGGSLVELRADGGHQTMIPPSIHPCGEAVRWDGDPWGGDSGPAEVAADELSARVAAVAVVAALAPAWPGEGSRHDASLALAGGLLRGCHSDADAQRFAELIVSALARVTGDEEVRSRVAESIPSTVGKLDAGEHVQGWPSLARLLRGSDPERAVRAARIAAGAMREAAGIVVADADGGVIGTAEPGDAAQPEPSEQPLTADEESAFWSSREVLRTVQNYARARRIGRWALLGAVLARAAAEVPPSVVLPPTRGTAASLNLYVGLCSESGGGKSAAMGAADEVLEVRGGAAPLETSLGSGEGLLAAYVHVEKEKGRAPRVVQHRASVLFDVDEVGSLGALAARTSSTLLPFLKSAWSGRLLATQNADADRLRRVEAHAYRLAIVAGVQPKHAGTILDDDGGGFPQRWLWMPTYDAAMPSRDEQVPEPAPYLWQVPGLPVEVAEDGTVTVQRARPMVLPAEAVAAILDAAEASNRPIGAGTAAPGTAALDGHALLSRAKVAALLALLEGRGEEVSAADWTLAGVVMRVSDHTRASIVRVRGAEASREADRRAVRQGRSSFLAREAEEDTRLARVMGRLLVGIRDRSREHGGPVPRGEVRKLANSRDRDAVPEALERLTSTGQIIAEERTGGTGRTVTYYSAAVSR